MWNGKKLKLLEQIKDLGRRYKPVHLCWLFKTLNLPVPKYFIGTTDPVFYQESFRFRNDDGSESAATWYALLNADVNDLDNDVNYRIRINVKEQNIAVGKNEDITFQYSKNSGAWTTLDTVSSNIKAVTSANFSNLDNSTQQLTTGGFDTTNAAMCETGACGGAVLDPPQNSYVETELCFQIISADVGNGDTIDIRVLFDGALDSWTQVPRITVAIGATTHYLVGSIDSVSLLSGAINVKRILTGSVDSVSLLSGAINVKRTLIGSANSLSLLSGAINVKRTLAGSADSLSLLSGDLSIVNDDFVFIAAVSAHNENSGTILDCAVDLDIKAGDLLVACVRWYNVNTTATIAESGGGNTLTKTTRQDNGSGGYFQMGYKIDAIVDATTTMRFTLASAATYRCIIVFQFRPKSGDTVYLDDGDSPGNGSDANPTSGLITTTGIDEVVVGASSTHNWGLTPFNPEIGGVTALELTVEHPIPTNEMLAMYYKLFTTTKTNIFSEDTRENSNLWLANILSFKAVEGGITRYLVGSIDSVSLLSGVFNIDIKLIGSIDSVSLLSGTAKIINNLSGALDSISLLSGNINIDTKLIGSIDSVSLLSGGINLDIKLIGSADSVSLLIGDLTIVGGGITHYLIGSIDSVSLLSGNFNIDIKLIGSANSVSLLSGLLKIINNLYGALNSVSLLSGTTRLIHGLSGSIDSVSLLSGILNITKRIEGLINSTSLLTGNLKLINQLVGSLNSISLLIGNLSIVGEVAPIKIVELTSNIIDEINRTSNIIDEINRTSNIISLIEEESNL